MSYLRSKIVNDYYTELSFDDWNDSDNLQEIQKDAGNNTKACDILTEGYIAIAGGFHSYEDKVEQVIGTCHLETERLSKMPEQYEESASENNCLGDVCRVATIFFLELEASQMSLRSLKIVIFRLELRKP